MDQCYRSPTSTQYFRNRSFYLLHLFLFTILIFFTVQGHTDDAKPTQEKKETPKTNPQQAPKTNPQPVESPSPKKQPINCQYKISADQDKISTDLIKKWTAKAVEQAFDFQPDKLEVQLKSLEDCFTEKGWKSFHGALKESGNLSEIKKQTLTVSSQVEGEIQLSDVKGNQWKATVPLNVVYQNNKEKLTQHLKVDVLIGRKMSGALGMMQVIATPKQKDTSSSSN